MTFTYDLATDIGRVRRTIPDKTSTEFVWTDEEITSFITDEGDWRRASAAALEAIATDELLVLKVVKIQNIETNVDRMMAVLLKRADKLRELAVQAEEDTGGTFDVIETLHSVFSYRDKLGSEAIREL